MKESKETAVRREEALATADVVRDGASRLPLDQPLSQELLQRSSRGPSAYQRFPVFSWRWWRGRTALFAIAAAAWGALSAFAHWVQTREVVSAFLVFGAFMIGALCLFGAGPLFATWVRERRWSLRWERRMIPLALLLGVVVSFFADALSSGWLEELIPPEQPPVPEEPTAGALIVNLVILVMIYGLLGGFFAYRQYLRELRQVVEVARESEVKRLRVVNRELDLRMSALQAQLEPHFLFNALASVRSLVESDTQAATEAIDALTDYLRATIPRLSDEGGVHSTLGNQGGLCRTFLQLMALRMGRLSFDVHIDESLRDVPFPPLVLHTLVENAIQHGVEPKQGPACITLAAKREDAAIVITVEDDGVGLQPGIGGSGVGLRNVRQQLSLRYGEAVSFSLGNRAGGGVKVTIVIAEATP